MSIFTDEQLDLVEVVELDDDTPIFTHIVQRGEDGKDAETRVLEARIYGTPVKAICGYLWVPSRDHRKHPICSKCQALYNLARDLAS